MTIARSALAVFLAPFPAACFQATVVAIWPKEGMGVFEHPSSMFVVIYLTFYAIGLVIGAPLFWLLRKRRPFSLSHYALLGGVTILLPISVALIAMGTQGHLSTYMAVYNIAFFAFGGAAAGSVICLLNGDRRTTSPE